MIILEGRELSFRYRPERCTIAEASVAIEAGSLTALIGSNGCGKSTLIKLLAGVLHPVSGCVLFCGDDLRSYRRNELAQKLAYVPQSTARAFPFTALEVVLTGRTPHASPFRLGNSADERRASEALEAVGILALAHRPITELSGGEQQLVSVARALAQDPECILLDEPASSLDLKHRAALIRMLNDLRHQNGLTVLMVTHDLAMLCPGFDFVFAMRNGAMAASGSPAAVLKDDVLAEVFDDPFIRARQVDGQLCVWSQVQG